MSRCLGITAVIAVAASLHGCGLHYAQLSRTGVVEPDETNAPVTRNEDGSKTLKAACVLEGTTQTVDYDPLLWKATRLPFVRSDEGDLVLIDTGLRDLARVTIDIVSRRRDPIHLGEPFDFSYTPILRVSNLEVRHLVSVVESGRWELRFLGVPLYRASGWALGLPVIVMMKYLMCDNVRERVTFGFEPFVPSAALSWSSYPLTFRDGGVFVSIPVAGQTLELVADTGGGPTLILTPQQWRAVSSGLSVSRSWDKRYPTWGAFEEFDAHRVDELSVGPVTMHDATVTVRKEAATDGLLGLGHFVHEVVVWDFVTKQLWIGQVKNAGDME